jgi:hypothetical protein
VHFRIRPKAIQVIRTAYDPASKRAKSRVLGRIERDTLEPTDALISACTAEEQREVAVWIDRYRHTGAVKIEMSAGRKESATLNRLATNTHRKRTALIVLGAHRSGTSALTRVLNLAGADLPEKLLPPIPGNNDRGFWEPVELVSLTERALADAGLDWSSPRRIETAWFSSEWAEHAVFGMVRFLERNFPGTDLFIIKDPRLCRLVPLLRIALARCDIDGRFILTLRHPSAVAASLEARDSLPLAYGRALWLRYMLDAEEFTRGARRVWLEDGDVLRDWRAVVRRVSRHFDIALRTDKAVAKPVSEYLDPSLVHHTGQANDRMPALIQAAWSALRDLRAGNNKKSLAQLDRVRAALDSADDVLGAAFSWEARLRMRYEQKAKQLAHVTDERDHLRAVQEKLAATTATQAQSLASQLSAHDALLEEKQEAAQNIAHLREALESRKNSLALAIDERDHLRTVQEKLAAATASQAQSLTSQQSAKDALLEEMREGAQKIIRLREALESREKSLNQLSARLQEEAMRNALLRLQQQQLRARFERRCTALEQRLQFARSMGQAVLERALMSNTDLPAGAPTATPTVQAADGPGRASA